MSEFWGSFFEGAKTVLIVFAIVNGSLLALFIVLMAIPRSKLRNFMLKIFSGILFCGTGIFLLWVVVPDMIPGPIDDVGALIGSVFTALAGGMALFQSKKIPERKKEEEKSEERKGSKIFEPEHASPGDGIHTDTLSEKEEFEEAEFEEVDED